MTPAQARLVEAIRTYLQQHQYPPTNRELASLVGIRSHSTVHQHLVRMREHGLVEYDGVRRLRLLV